jgi:GGDEF domain-containing protein
MEARKFLRHRQGHRIPVMVEAIPIRDDYGHIAAVAEIFQKEKAGPEGLCWISPAEAQTDVALGIPSYATTRQQLEMSFAQHPGGLGVFLIEVEHIEEFARSRGKEMIVALLRAVAQTLAHAMPMAHFLGAWSNRRFLMLAPNSNPELNEVLVKRLAALGNGCNPVSGKERSQYPICSLTGSSRNPGPDFVRMA